MTAFAVRRTCCQHDAPRFSHSDRRHLRVSPFGWQAANLTVLNGVTVTALRRQDDARQQAAGGTPADFRASAVCVGDESLSRTRAAARALAAAGYARDIGPGVYDVHSPVVPTAAARLRSTAFSNGA